MELDNPMLANLNATSNIRGQRIDLDCSWVSAGPRPDLRLVRGANCS